MVALSVSLVGGCAEMQWRKDGADATTLERDLAECRQQAQIQAERLAIPQAGSGPRIVGVDARGRPVVAQAEQLDSGRFFTEHDLTRDCMSKRGYKLVPAGGQ